MPTTPPSLRCSFTRRSEPAFFGTVWSIELNTPTIAAVRERIRVPIVAIGGITPENGASLLQAGVDMLAVVRGVFGGDDPAVAAGHYRQLFDQHLQDEKA